MNIRCSFCVAGVHEATPMILVKTTDANMVYVCNECVKDFVAHVARHLKAQRGENQPLMLKEVQNVSSK